MPLTRKASCRPPAGVPADDWEDVSGLLNPAEADDEIGRLGPYRVRRVLGVGGMGVVFLAFDPHLARPVAIKTLKPALAASSARHSALVRATHWITTFCFFALLVTGIEILISHPRFYWGEVGNSRTAPLFKIPIPSSRASVPTGYGYVLPDQNGWSRYLHFEAAWALVLTGVVYVISGFWTRHFRRNY